MINQENLEKFYRKVYQKTGTLDAVLDAVDALDELFCPADRKTEFKTALKELDKKINDSIESMGLTAKEGPNGENEFKEYYINHDDSIDRLLQKIKDINNEQYNLSGLVRDVEDKVTSLNSLLDSDSNNPTIKSILQGSEDGNKFLEDLGNIKKDLNDIIKLRQLRYEVTKQDKKLKKIEAKIDALKKVKLEYVKEELKELAKLKEEETVKLSTMNDELLDFKHNVDKRARRIISSNTRIGEKCEFGTYFKGLGSKVSNMNNYINNISELSDTQKNDIKENLDKISGVIKSSHTNKELTDLYDKYGIEGIRVDNGKKGKKVIPEDITLSSEGQPAEQVNPAEETPEQVIDSNPQRTAQPANPRSVKISKALKGVAMVGIVAGTTMGLVAGLPIYSAILMLGADKIGKWLSDVSGNINFKSRAERLQKRAERVASRMTEEERTQFIANLNQGNVQNLTM